MLYTPVLSESGISEILSSYYLKQLAQETILPLLDGRQLLNRVLVIHEEVS